MQVGLSSPFLLLMVQVSSLPSWGFFPLGNTGWCLSAGQIKKVSRKICSFSNILQRSPSFSEARWKNATSSTAMSDRVPRTPYLSPAGSSKHPLHCQSAHYKLWRCIQLGTPSSSAPRQSFPHLQQTKRNICKAMGMHRGASAAAAQCKVGIWRETPQRAWGAQSCCERDHWSSSSPHLGGLIDFTLPWLGYASCAMFPEIGIHMSGSMRAGCPSSV